MKLTIESVFLITLALLAGYAVYSSRTDAEEALRHAATLKEQLQKTQRTLNVTQDNLMEAGRANEALLKQTKTLSEMAKAASEEKIKQSHEVQRYKALYAETMTKIKPPVAKAYQCVESEVERDASLSRILGLWNAYCGMSENTLGCPGGVQ